MKECRQCSLCSTELSYRQGFERNLELVDQLGLLLKLKELSRHQIIHYLDLHHHHYHHHLGQGCLEHPLGYPSADLQSRHLQLLSAEVYQEFAFVLELHYPLDFSLFGPFDPLYRAGDLFLA